MNTTERVIYPPGSFPPSSLAAQQRMKPTTSNKSKNLKVTFPSWSQSWSCSWSWWRSWWSWWMQSRKTTSNKSKNLKVIFLLPIWWSITWSWWSCWWSWIMIIQIFDMNDIFIILLYIIYIHHHQFWPFSTEPSLVKGDGDGTVNIRSLKVIVRWWRWWCSWC